MSKADSEKLLKNRINELEQENKRLHDTVEYLTRKLFGRSSEKTSALDLGQISFFDEAEITADPKAPEPNMQQVENYARKKFKGQRAELLKNLPHIKRLASLFANDRDCELCGTELVRVGEEFVRTEIEFIPAQINVIDHYRETYECRTCRKHGRPYMEKAPMPDPVIQHSMASPSSVAWVMHQKFVNALPLYRQEKEWEMLGVQLSRATMANWIMAASRDWLSPIVERMHAQLLKEKHLHADETTVQVMQEENRKNTTDSYMWVYSTGASSETPIRIFEYQPGRGGQYPQKFLKGFNGYLHTDAFSGYEKVHGVTRCLCWTHLRRYFVDSLPKDIKSPEATLPSKGIAFCNELFRIEKTLDALSCEKRKEERLKQEKPVLDSFWDWVEANHMIVPPKSKAGEAFRYALNHKVEFMNYLNDGACSISNNLAENSIRPFTIGRKNWLFSGSPKGAVASATVYSIIETAKANGLNPYKYLSFLFKEMPGVLFKQYPEFLEDYLPWNSIVQDKCK